MGLIAACAFLLAVDGASAQVNIEQHRPREEGMSLALDVAVSIRSGNSDLYDVSTGGSYHYQMGRNTILALARFRYGENDGTEFVNSSFGHLRYTRRLSTVFAAEVFGQLERDRFTLLQVRSLLGGGARLQIVGALHVEIFYGTSIMLELENLDETKVGRHPASSEVTRWSNYASARWTINDRSFLSSTVYVQPRIDAFKDVRLLHDAAFEVAVTDRVSLRVVLRQRFDNRPPDSLEKHDVFLENGIRVRI